MENHQNLSRQLSEAVKPLLETAHSLGYQVVSFRLAQAAAPVGAAAIKPAFGGCTTECGYDENGHLVCHVHCP